MAVSQALLQVLNNEEEPLEKRLKIANNAFNTSEFLVQRKEALLLKWIVSVSAKEDSAENGPLWDHINAWLGSKELTQNDITNDDIFSIIQVFRKTQLKETPNDEQKLINAVLLLCSNKVFQQYFKYNLELYCKLIACSVQNLHTEAHFIEIINKPCLFPKQIFEIEGFSKQFLAQLYDVLVRKVMEFQDNQQVFREAVQIVEKCLLQGHIKDFQSFFNRLFDPEDGEKDHSSLPKSIFKHLASTCTPNDSTAKISFKLFFAAFSSSCKDHQCCFKCLLLLVQLLQFDVSKEFEIKTPFKQKYSIPLSKSLNIVLGILDILSLKTFSDCTVGSTSVTEFLRKFLKSLMGLNILNPTVFEIILKCILINPLVVEPLISSLFVFIMLKSHQQSGEMYEKVVIAVFEVFAKLHRVENLVSKLIPALKNAFISEPPSEEMQIFEFKGEQDITIAPQEILPVEKVFTKNILEYFTKCLIQLASWQVINVFKSMLHHLKNTVEEFSQGAFDEEDSNGQAFLELLGTLTTSLLQSIRIADHAIPQNVVTKFVNGLEELKIILRNFGSAILKREHNHTTMRTFLSLGYVWAEIFITLTYYSINNEVQVPTETDSLHSAVDLTYLHSYMDVKEWQLIEQRISNFGKYPCKRLLQKLYIQKVKSMLLFERKLNDEMVANVAILIPVYLDDTWEDLLMDKFAVNTILHKMDTNSLIFLAEHLIGNDVLFQENHVKDSMILINAMTYVTMSKIQKLFTIKRKRDAEQGKTFSSTVFCLFPKELFFNRKGASDVNAIVEKAKHIYETWEDCTSFSIKSKEAQLMSYFGVLKKLPFIYSEANMQKCILLYFMALNKDLQACSDDVKTCLEDLIIGILQTFKFPLSEIFNLQTLGEQVLSNFSRYSMLFSLIIDNAFKDESSILGAEPLISSLVKQLDNSKHLNASLVVLQAVGKVKKSKMDPTLKEQTKKYTEKILKKLAKLVCKADYLVESYAICLKHYIAVEKEPETLNKLLAKLEGYLEYSLANISDENKKGCTLLFTLVLQHRAQIKIVKDDIVLKIWNSCKQIEIGQNFTHLVTLIVSQIPNEEFQVLVEDLLQLTEETIKSRSFIQLAQKLKTWESILACDVNATKMNICQKALENLICELLPLLTSPVYDEPLLRSIINLQQRLLQTQHFIMSPPLIDMLLMSPSLLMKTDDNFEGVFSLSISILEMFLKNRNALVMDRLPVYLQQYRVLLKSVTSKSNSDASSVEKIDVETASNSAHRLEKLTKNLVSCKRDMGRIAAFLIADILERYEQINLYPNVKLHLNNCVYSLISLCDHHAISYLMRVLSNASTEMFKIMFEHYKKYYRFTGKV